jgi:cytochrome c biogenesis protein CcdA/DsbC/DsbD-like thiol-disulfide interchange protein/thiol-disulfide isomerase/thioredoxin
MRRHLSTARLAILVCVLLPAAALLAQDGPPPRAQLTPLLEQDSAAPGDAVRVALRVSLPEGLHANAHKPRDPSLIPLVLTVTAPAGVTVEEIVYPEPTDLRQENAPQPLSVYEREFVIGAVLRVAASAAAGPLEVPLRLRYQACNEKLCYLPTSVQAAWTLPIGAGKAARTNREVFGRIRFGTGEAPPAAAAPATAAGSTPPGVPSGTGDPAAGVDRLTTRFTTLGTAAGYLDRADFLTFIHNAENGIVEKGWFEGRGPLAILFIVIVGGLALNLTPCVLPMIPINLAIIGAGAQAGSRRRGFLLGATYGGAMAVVYGVLGLVVILTAGTFGTINSSPWFNLAIAVVFVLLALAMFDVIEIDFSRFSSRFQVADAKRGSFLLAFTLGALAALLAGACVAPVVIQVVLFASDLYSSGTKLALMLPFLLGLGMALPWPVAGAGIAALPKPGPWMVRVKQAFGVFILITAAYYGYLSYELLSNRWVDAAEVEGSVAAKLKEGWYSSLDQGLAAAERERKPVLIDFWATWCKNCLTMDKTTLADPEVGAALAGYVKIKFQAESPDEPPAVDVMRRFDAIGLPTYVILKPR